MDIVMEIVWIYYGFSDAITYSIVWISLFFSVMHRIFALSAFEYFLNIV